MTARDTDESGDEDSPGRRKAGSPADHSHDDHDAEHDHDESGDGESASVRKLGVVAVINTVGFVVELAGGLLFGSLALLSDAVHMLFDALSYVMAFAATYTAERYETPGEWTFGLHRLEPLAALLNGALLVPMALVILYESYQRFLDPVQLDPGMTIVLATGGLAVNVASVIYLHGDELSLNERGAFYHLLGDTGASVAVIVSTAIVAVFDIRAVDPVTAALIAVVIIWSAYTVLRDSLGLILERSPIPVADLRSDLVALDGVDAVSDCHVWQVCSRLTVATVALSVSVDSLDAQERLRERVHEQVRAAGVDHATVELATDQTATTYATDHAH
ncbi:cation transporter (plasmid) [Halarchaeum sp. CBA1220]|uniref:cation diffusion facilitator family transporter n=1 Tax=Halarchaeum sp. CBA1220 TaxID=1853682 RepID=UPI000F3A82F4|nr:cation diffusion facilitator family transporter [Halarchaeum sp. CBA1220]QLC35669.1 cation transporter [Halarchaeum sp. CBA1220]